MNCNLKSKLQFFSSIFLKLAYIYLRTSYKGVYMLVSDLLNYFPEEILKILTDFFETETEEKLKTIEEIRLRVGQPLILKFNKCEKIFKYNILQEDILKTMQKVCENSIYSFQNQIKEGFITVKGGHRIGITGNCIIEGNKVTNINYISSLNFRIAKEVKGCSNKILKYVLDLENNNVYTTLIVSPPGVRENNNTSRLNT